MDTPVKSRIQNNISIKRIPDGQVASETLTVTLQIEIPLKDQERLASGLARVMNFIASGCTTEEFQQLSEELQAKIQRLRVEAQKQ